jgi:DNA-directed RNA polymerase subunit RPC12/RpoP
MTEINNGFSRYILIKPCHECGKSLPNLMQVDDEFFAIRCGYCGFETNRYRECRDACAEWNGELIVDAMTLNDLLFGEEK